jgi:hypothetical protein
MAVAHRHRFVGFGTDWPRAKAAYQFVKRQTGLLGNGQNLLAGIDHGLLLLAF